MSPPTLSVGIEHCLGKLAARRLFNKRALNGVEGAGVGKLLFLRVGSAHCLVCLVWCALVHALFGKVVGGNLHCYCMLHVTKTV